MRGRPTFPLIPTLAAVVLSAALWGCDRGGAFAPDAATGCESAECELPPTDGCRDDSMCTAPEANRCADDDTLLAHDPAGTCVAGGCEYTTTTHDCPNGCDQGACVGAPCIGVVCSVAPASVCDDASTLRRFDSNGTCNTGFCEYASTTQDCPDGCSDGTCVAAAGSHTVSLASLFGSSQWERIQSIVVDDSGYIYVGGTTFSSSIGGATAGTGCSTNGHNGFISKLQSDGSSVVWTTFLCGNARDDLYGVRVDGAGNVYVAGWTASTNFPTTVGAFDRTHNGQMDIFAAKINSSGTVVYSTLIGSGGTDQCRGGMFIDSQGDLYMSGYTDSINFPTTAGAYDRTYSGGYGDGFVLKLSMGGNGQGDLVHSTFLGSTGADFAFTGVNVHTDGSVYVAGLAGAADFPTTGGAYQTSFGGTSTCNPWCGDVFVARLESDLSGLIYSTFLGGTANENGAGQNGLFVDAEGQATVVGTTQSSDFPTTAGAYQSTANLAAIDRSFFASRLSADGTSLEASTLVAGATLGPNGGYEASGVAVDSAGRTYFAGQMASADYPVTSDAHQSSIAGHNDTVLTVLSPDMDTIVYSTLYGGNGPDRTRDLYLDPAGAYVVLGGSTESSDFPALPGAYDTSHNGSSDGWFARIDIGPSRQ